jgi:hypothetical protein
VIIKGKVTVINSLIFVKYFNLKDSTGEIVVVAPRPLPKVGEELRVKGKVQEAFSIGDQHYTVLEEEAVKEK